MKSQVNKRHKKIFIIIFVHIIVVAILVKLYYKLLLLLFMNVYMMYIYYNDENYRLLFIVYFIFSFSMIKESNQLY